MNDLDTRLAARFAQIKPPADFDARFAARLATEQQRAARRDRVAELQRALQQHVRQQTMGQRALRAALLRWILLGGLGLLGVAVSVSWWQQLARGIAGAVGTSNSTLLLALTFGVPVLVGLAAALGPRSFVRTLTGR